MSSGLIGYEDLIAHHKEHHATEEELRKRIEDAQLAARMWEQTLDATVAAKDQLHTSNAILLNQIKELQAENQRLRLRLVDLEPDLE